MTRKSLLRKVNTLILPLIASTPIGGLKASECNNILIAGSGIIDKKIVRYLVTSKSPCPVIQIKIPGGKGRHSAEETICSINDKNLATDFSKVHVIRGEFRNDTLFFEILLTPTHTNNAKRKLCQLSAIDKKPGKLICHQHSN